MELLIYIELVLTIGSLILNFVVPFLPIAQSTSGGSRWGVSDPVGIGKLIFAILILVGLFALTAYFLDRRLKRIERDRERFGEEFESLVEQIELFDVEPLLKNHLRLGILKTARDDLRRSEKCNLQSLTLKTISSICNNLIPPITVAKLTVALLIPWLETETITALLASIGLIALNLNNQFNLEAKTSIFEQRSKDLRGHLWRALSQIDEYANIPPNAAAKLCLSKCEFAIATTVVPEVEPDDEDKDEDKKDE